jgi:hypothetical protein
VVTLKGTTDAEGRISPIASAALARREQEDLRDLALALPPGWVVQLEPPHGQLAIRPASYRPRFHRCWVASRDRMKLFRDDGRLTF